MNKKLIAIICAVALFNQAGLTKSATAAVNEKNNLSDDNKVNGAPQILGVKDKDVYVGQRGRYRIFK